MRGRQAKHRRPKVWSSYAMKLHYEHDQFNKLELYELIAHTGTDRICSQMPKSKLNFQTQQTPTCNYSHILNARDMTVVFKDGSCQNLAPNLCAGFQTAQVASPLELPSGSQDCLVSWPLKDRTLGTHSNHSTYSRSSKNGSLEIKEYSEKCGHIHGQICWQTLQLRSANPSPSAVMFPYWLSHSSVTNSQFCYPLQTVESVETNIRGMPWMTHCSTDDRWCKQAIK